MNKPKSAGQAGRQKKIRIRWVDGFRIRNIVPDFDLVESYSTSLNQKGELPTPFIPKGEIWVDRRFKNEAKFLIKVHKIEQRLWKWPYGKVRDYLKKTLCRKGPVPKFVVRTEKRGRLTICYVKGEIVRQYLDPAFIFGGHDLVYPDYIPANQVWIDIRQDPAEIKYTFAHELFEYGLMKKGMFYRNAHARATEMERKMRNQEFVTPKYKPLKMKPWFRETQYLCGPASLKIVFDYFGREYDEKVLSTMAGVDLSEGADHEDLIKAAEALGASAFEKSGGTIDELKYFIREKRLPVIIGWWSASDRTREEVLLDTSKDEGHYSVVYHITDSHIYMMDPSEKTSGKTKLTIKKFMEKWWDLDTPGYALVDRWYMVLNFEGKTFDVPGGINH